MLLGNKGLQLTLFKMVTVHFPVWFNLTANLSLMGPGMSAVGTLCH